jgi:hypothetical protein
MNRATRAKTKIRKSEIYLPKIYAIRRLQQKKLPRRRGKARHNFRRREY